MKNSKKWICALHLSKNEVNRWGLSIHYSLGVQRLRQFSNMDVSAPTLFHENYNKAFNWSTIRYTFKIYGHSFVARNQSPLFCSRSKWCNFTSFENITSQNRSTAFRIVFNKTWTVSLKSPLLKECADIMVTIYYNRNYIFPKTLIRLMH